MTYKFIWLVPIIIGSFSLCLLCYVLLTVGFVQGMGLAVAGSVGLIALSIVAYQIEQNEKKEKQ